MREDFDPGAAGVRVWPAPLVPAGTASARVPALVLGLVLALLAAAPLRADEPESHPRVLRVLIGTALTLHGGDLGQTMYCFGAARCREWHPVFAPLSDHPFAFGAVKVGVAAAANAAIWKLHHTHPRLAFAILAAQIASEGFAVVHNGRELARIAR